MEKAPKVVGMGVARNLGKTKVKLFVADLLFRNSRHEGQSQFSQRVNGHI